MELSNSQKQAVESKNPHILVSAGAGSGKTAVLSSRVAKLVEEGTPISKILVVTFTKAAASEMKVRIQKKLCESEVLFAREQAEEIELATITTLHGFASKILKQYFFEIEVDPAFAVLDDGAAKAFQTQAMDAVLRKLTMERNEAFFDLVDVFFQNRKDEPLRNAIFEMHNFLCSLPDPTNFLELSQNCYKNAEETSAPIAFMIEECSKRAEFFRKKLELLMVECQSKHAIKLVDALGELEINLLRIKKDNTLAQMNVAISSYSAPTKIMKNGFEELATKVSSLKTQVKKFFESLADMFCVDADKESQKEDLKACEKRVESLVSLCKMFEGNYENLKRETGALDFSDLERKLYELLKNKTVREQIAKEFDYLFVDEYQDTNRLQEAIYKNLGIENMFFVGDAKQSIYGFRLAEPKIFLDERQALRNSGGEVVALSENYRSHEGIIEFTNKLFSKIMTKEVGGEDYEKEGTMEKGGTPFESQAQERTRFPRVKVCAIKKAKAQEKEERKLPVYSVVAHENSSDEKMSSAIAEGRMLASVLKELDGQKIFDAREGKMRVLEAKDIAVLSSSRGEYLKTVLRTAEEEGYSFSTDIAQNVFEDADMSVLLAFLELVSNPKQDIPLVTCLASDFCGLSSNELAEIKLCCEKDVKFFHEVIEDFALKNPKPEQKETWKKVASLKNLICELRFESSHKSLLELVEWLCEKIYFCEIVGQKKNGDQKLLLLEALKEKLAAFDKNADLDEFLDYEKNVGFVCESRPSASRGVAVLDEEGNAVSTFQNILVTTIHKSKGLEFPVVILIGAGRMFNRDDLSKDFLISRNFGMGVSSFDTLERVKSGNLIKNAMKLDLQKQLLEEDIRLLYVAVTRAINHFVVIGVGDPTDPDLQNKNILSSSSFFDLLSKFDFDNNFLLARVVKSSFEMLSQKKLLSTPTPTFELPTNKNYVEKMEKAFAYEYPNKNALLLAKKYSVTEIAQMSLQKEVVPLAGESSTEIGNAYHHIMQFISFNTKTKEQLLQEKIRLDAEHLVSVEEWNLVDEDKILNCLNSPLFEVLRKGKRKILREQEFLMRATAKELGISEADDEVLVQGVFDLVIFDAEKVLILDYKTGGPKTDDAIVLKHKRQMELYKLAAEKAFGKEIGVVIYSFEAEKMVKVFA